MKNRTLEQSRAASKHVPSIRTSRLRWPVAAVGIALLLGSVLAANVVTTDYGFVPVGFGLEATAGTFFAGIALASRDAIQDAVGRWAVVWVILAGTLVSFIVAEPAIAIASAAAFGVAELLDFAVYTPIRSRARIGDRRWALAVVLSNIVGAFADTVVFLGIAFGAAAIAPALAGQMVGKFYATLAYLALGWLAAMLFRRWLARRRG